MKKMSHVIILLDRNPGVSLDYFKRQVFASLKHDGRAYTDCIDDSTEIAIQVVGPQNFQDEIKIAANALVGGKALFKSPPDWNDMHFQNFSWSEGCGTTIEEWVDV